MRRPKYKQHHPLIFFSIFPLRDYIYIYIHTYIHIYIHTYIHIYIYIYIYIKSRTYIIVINNIVSYLNVIYLVSSRGICSAAVEKLRSVRRKNFNSRYTSNCRFSMRERHFVLRKVIFFSLTRPKNRISIHGQHSVLSTKEKEIKTLPVPLR